MALATLLADVPASRFIASSPVFSVESSTSLRDAVRVLHENKVTGAPVVVDEVTSVRRWSTRPACCCCCCSTYTLRLSRLRLQRRCCC